MYILSETDNNVTKEQAECFEILKKFLQTCKSNAKSIELRDMAKICSINDYGIDTAANAAAFILNNISVIGICKKEQFGYGKKNPHAPFIYEYIFKYNDEDDNLGCLAFYKNPDTHAKIKWYIKTLHKDYMNRIIGKTKEVFWLSIDQKQLLEKLI